MTKARDTLPPAPTRRPAKGDRLALVTDGLTKQYGRRLAVDSLSLEVPAGVVAGFIGPNGAGKTTTMAMLLGLVSPTTGSGTVLGASLDEPASYLDRVGALIETPAFWRASPASRTSAHWPPSGGTISAAFLMCSASSVSKRGAATSSASTRWE
jgi:ABC-type ATPase with predicted acetyltransferase domain